MHQTATIIPNSNATKRTKETVKNHGPTFNIEWYHQKIPALDGQSAILLKSQKTDWLGWLPHSEITVQVCETCNGTGSFVGNDQHPNGAYIEETCHCHPKYYTIKPQDKLYILPPLNPDATPLQDPIKVWLDEATQRLKNNTDYVNEVNNMIGTDYEKHKSRKEAIVKENDFITQAINLITAKY